MLGSIESQTAVRVAVMHQGGPTPAVGGTVSVFRLVKQREPSLSTCQIKPPKPGGYKDSSSDIAYTLQQCGIDVALSTAAPNPASEDGWCEPH